MGWLPLYLVLLMGICLLEMDVFDVNAWAIKRLMSDTYINIKKVNCQELTLQLERTWHLK